MARVLLVNPPSCVDVYSDSKIRVATITAPFFTLEQSPGQFFPIIGETDF